MRWIIGCVCCLLFPSVSAAKCRLTSFAYVHCVGKDHTNSALAPWEQLDDFFPAEHIDRTRWAVERENPEEPHSPVLRLGVGPQLSYHKRDITLIQDCWHFTFRAFSKIGLACRSRF